MAARKLFINLGADTPADGLVTSFASNIAAPSPSFARGDNLDVELHFLTPTTDTAHPFAYVDPAAWSSVRVGAGPLDQAVDSGTFTLTFTAGTTGALAYNASAATVQTAIRALGGGVASAVVTGNAGGPWSVDLVTLAAYATPTGTATAISPSGSTVIVENTEDGSASLSEKFLISLAAATPVLRTSGWTALTSALVTVTTVQAGSATANKVFRVVWNADAYQGAVLLTFTGDTIAGTAQIGYAATAAEVVTAFEAHTDVDDDGVAVTKNAAGDYTIELVGAGIRASNTPALATSSNTLGVPPGLSGRLACNTATFTAALEGESEIHTYFEVEINRAAASPETVVRVSDCLFTADLLRNTPGSSAGVYFPTTADVILGTKTAGVWLVVDSAITSALDWTVKMRPSADGGAALGDGGRGWASLFLSAGGIFNIANGNWVATHTTGILTVGTGDFRVTTAGTNSASAVTVGGTQTLTNKTLTSPALTTPALGTVASGVISACTSTSMVMVTPVLGTPTSGTLTNCTSIPVANATGILAVANGGTGSATFGQYVWLYKDEANGTGSQTLTQNTWTTVSLDTEGADASGICSLSSDKFTLTAGTYRFRAVVPLYATDSAKIRLYNVTDSSTVLVGPRAYAYGASFASCPATIIGRFTIAASKELAVQIYAKSAAGKVGYYGESIPDEVEIYTQIEIWRE